METGDNWPAKKKGRKRERNINKVSWQCGFEAGHTHDSALSMPRDSSRPAIPIPGASGQHGQCRSWAKLPPGCFIKACRTSAVGRGCVTAHRQWRSYPGRWVCGGIPGGGQPNKHGRAHEARAGVSQRQELKQSDVGQRVGAGHRNPCRGGWGWMMGVDCRGGGKSWGRP